MKVRQYNITKQIQSEKDTLKSKPIFTMFIG